jgi:hypothetical protein
MLPTEIGVSLCALRSVWQRKNGPVGKARDFCNIKELRANNKLLRFELLEISSVQKLL